MGEPSHYRVAVFARNEKCNIVKALSALLDACPRPRDLKIFVLINGCTDGTPEIVKAFAAAHAEVHPVELPIADKCNAWNTYVYHWADDSPVHYFTDGDVVCSPQALPKLQQMLLATPTANAIAGVPLAGRNKARYQRYLAEHHWLFGNLYAVKNAQLTKLRAAGVRLPIGLCGNDYFISKCMAARSLYPTDIHWKQNIYHPDAGYCFESLQPYRWRDWIIYWNRRISYALRQLQIPELDRVPLTKLPATMDQINRRILARLDMQRPGLLDIWTRGVHRRLRQMYPSGHDAYFERLLPWSNHAAASPLSSVA